MNVKSSTAETLLNSVVYIAPRKVTEKEGNPQRYIISQGSVDHFCGSTSSLSPVWFTRVQSGMIKKVAQLIKELLNNLLKKFPEASVTNHPRCDCAGEKGAC